MSQATVSVAGTGVMGSALARALLAHLDGGDVTVWNRSPERAEPLREHGAEVASSLLEAIQASPVLVMCVSDQAAARELLSAEGVSEALRGRALVQLTTGTGSDGRHGAEFAAAHGIAYLDGAIMAYPRTIGTDAAVLLFAGDKNTFAEHADLLAALGTAHYLGEDAGQPAVLDAALIALFYGTLAGFVHGAVLCRAEGISDAQYVELGMPFFRTFVSDAVQETGQRILAQDYSDAQSSMDTHFGGINLLVVGASHEAKVDTTVMEAIRDSFARAIAAGRGHEDIACLVEAPDFGVADR